MCVWHRSLCVLQCSPVRAQAGVGVDWIHLRLLGQFLLHKLIRAGQRVTLSGDRQQQQLEVVVWLRKGMIPVFSLPLMSKKTN